MLRGRDQAASATSQQVSPLRAVVHAAMEEPRTKMREAELEGGLRRGGACNLHTACQALERD